jgi:DNA-binding response OmpR family regulator
MRVQEIKEIIQRRAVDVVSQLGGRWRRQKVLLVEDDKSLRRFLEVTLERGGYEVVTAGDGLEGMKVALTVDVDIVVTDAMMPNLSGHEFCRFLRNSQQLAHLPIVLLSGSEVMDCSGEKELVNVFLSKPVSPEELTDCVRTLLAAS